MFRLLKTPRYMMATTAKHQLGDISRDEEDYCYIKEETKGWYRGSWVTGYGFFNVRFPKETTRELTEEETKFVQNQRLVIV